MKSSPPCSQNCKDRYVGCHGKCLAYLEYWEQHQQELKDRVNRCKVADYVFDAVHRSRTSTREGKEKYA